MWVCNAFLEHIEIINFIASVCVCYLLWCWQRREKVEQSQTDESERAHLHLNKEARMKEGRKEVGEILCNIPASEQFSRGSASKSHQQTAEARHFHVCEP
jgi:hypothetical protein